MTKFTRIATPEEVPEGIGLHEIFTYRKEGGVYKVFEDDQFLGWVYSQYRGSWFVLDARINAPLNLCHRSRESAGWYLNDLHKRYPKAGIHMTRYKTSIGVSSNTCNFQACWDVENRLWSISGHLNAISPYELGVIKDQMNDVQSISHDSKQYSPEDDSFEFTTYDLYVNKYPNGIL